MKLRPILAKLMLVLVTAAAALLQPTASATHFRYGSLSWAPTATSGEVEFRLVNGFRRARFPGQGSAVDGLPQLGDIFNDGHTEIFHGDGTFTTIVAPLSA